ncbi:hypothetical protein [Polaribacter sp.]|uniref:hypothetical protein n=1 Tax=Polaribacter sp. TaxID=1920175 RepID=UPI003F6C738D
MKTIKLLFFAIIAILTFNNCEQNVEPLGTNYITFSEPTYSAGVDVGGTNTINLDVFTANITSSDRSFEVMVDGSGAAAGSYTVPSSFIIPGGTNKGVISVELSDTNLGIGVNKIVIDLGVQEGLSIAGPATISYTQNCTEVTATLDIVFDGYGSETGWTITDSLGGVVASKEAGDYTDGQVSAQESVALCAGRDYTFTITDSYGDGLSFPANGTYSLSVGGTVKANGVGNFGESEATAFDTK